MSPYVPFYSPNPWEDSPDTDTPVTAAALTWIEAGIAAAGSGGGVAYENVWAAGTTYKAGDVVTYNGVTYIAVNPSTGQTPPAAYGTTGYGTSLPASPVDGQEYTLVDSITNPSYQWRFRYNAGSSSAYRWEFVGGADAFASVSADESTTTTVTWLDLTTVGPRVIVPRIGDYDGWGAAGTLHSAANVITALGIANGAIAPVDRKDSSTGGASFTTASGAVSSRFLGIAASSDIRLRYLNNNAGTAHWLNRWLRVRPVRVA